MDARDDGAAEADARGQAGGKPRLRRYPSSDDFGNAGLEAVRQPSGRHRNFGQDLYQLASLVEVTWTLVGQAAAGARDRDLLQVVDRCAPQTSAQAGWLRMRMKAAAAQTLLVAP